MEVKKLEQEKKNVDSLEERVKEKKNGGLKYGGCGMEEEKNGRIEEGEKEKM